MVLTEKNAKDRAEEFDSQDYRFHSDKERIAYGQIPLFPHDNLIIPRVELDGLNVDLVSMLLEAEAPQEVYHYLVGENTNFQEIQQRYDTLVFSLYMAAKTLVDTINNPDYGGSKLPRWKQNIQAEHYVRELQIIMLDELEAEYCISLNDII
ncbi:hypothetical protein HN789_02955 [archaeon]|jgi:hypothetical protein|nr:hypothetical protein [archaeon]MBT4023237.1 hypothetical protein [archaeon]MBT4271907.1 hypothetical protein [archaeon]MBT4461006.1 hypothetical protein [archaeon]MBT4858418.1 hypothetical protein [archaeon]